MPSNIPPAGAKPQIPPTLLSKSREAKRCKTKNGAQAWRSINPGSTAMSR
jgi:hypothetical protein